MEQTKGTALPDMSDPIRAVRHPAARSPAHLPRSLAANADFCAVFDSSAEVLIVIDAGGVIQMANPRARDLLRLKESANPRTGLGDLLAETPADKLAFLWGDSSPSAAARSLDASLASGTPIRIVLRTILPGSRLLLLCIEDGPIVGRAEVEWRHVEAELRGVLDSLQVGVVLLDSSGRIRFSNARFGQLFGLGVRQLRESSNFEQLPDLIGKRFRNPDAFLAPWKSYGTGAGGPEHDELELTRPVRRVIERFSRPILDARGRPVGWCELYSDVTGERQIEAKLLQTEKTAALGQLVSGIAHELNNPLTAIMGYTQLLLGRGLGPAQLSEAEKVYEQAERARRIVKNLLYFARENKSERTRVNLNEVVERTVALRSYEFKIENIQVESELDPNLPLTMADPYQLQQVVLNLLINAEQALLEERGSGRVRIRTSHLACRSAKRSGGRIFLEVSDDGPGVPRAIASRIFDPFFTTKPPGVGTGLGLSIVYGIVQQHDGEVTFDNQPGAGAKFRVELPVVPVPEADPDRSAASAHPPDRPLAVSAGRILVVEDEPTVAQLIVDVLREEGHHAEAALDSREGLTRISRSEYDLVICDLRMPRLDGPAFYDALVQAGSPAREKILFITGDTLAPRTLEFLEPNGFPYLAKPFLVEELKLAVNRLLVASRTAAPNGPVPVR
jgi:signal transduction histidine kinase/ActR/RegA family two-component response regulator